MGWSLGYCKSTDRYIGYGVPAYCDHPDCDEEIDRGLAYRCGELHENDGCGLYFCERHRDALGHCGRCRSDAEPHSPKDDHPDWIRHVLTDDSWAEWRNLKAAELTAGPPKRITSVK